MHFNYNFETYVSENCNSRLCVGVLDDCTLLQTYIIGFIYKINPRTIIYTRAQPSNSFHNKTAQTTGKLNSPGVS